MLQVESEGYYVDNSLEFGNSDAGACSYQNAPLMDNFTTSQSYMEPYVVEATYSTVPSEQYFSNHTTLGNSVSTSGTSVLSSSCETTPATSNLTGEQIFQEAMRYVQEQTETITDKNSTASDYTWESYAVHPCM